ncbi:6-phosphofructo-2-kinase-domain-containing protein [Gorgonomyces haynaldii]|nr:6-phosphofructo-2-kinase-domain-containing protein [Gorgonomyces haynaldii]
MVGLPARGKSYICKKLSRYLNWCGFNTKVFNVGNRRRVMKKRESITPTAPDSLLRQIPVEDASTPIGLPGETTHDAAFFDASNQEAKELREQLAMDTLDESIAWLRKEGSKVAIHDATNSTIIRRKALLQRIEMEEGISAFFIESICPEGPVLEKNIKMKLSGPDYVNMDPQVAMEDFKQRIRNYEKVYQTISPEEDQRLSYIKVVNVGEKVIAHRIRGYIPSQCVFYLMQIHIKERVVWLSRHGESLFNIQNRVGGDPPLSPRGLKYTEALVDFIKHIAITPPDSPGSPDLDDIPKDERKFQVWTSCLQRAMEVGDRFDPKETSVTNIKFLNEIYSGQFEGMTYEDIKRWHPDEWQQRQENKLLYRYPGAGGESYLDVIERLRPVIIELERMQSGVLVVTHQVVMRTLLAYFLGVPLQEMPTLSVPLHTLYCLKPKPYGADLYRYVLDESTGRLEFAGEGLE